MEHFRVKFLPDDKEILIHRGATLLEAAGQAGIILNTPCGGKGTCGKCRVRIEPTGDEVPACQYPVESDIIVFVPEASRYFRQQILEHGITRQMHVEPTVRKVRLADLSSDAAELKALLEKEFGRGVSFDEELPEPAAFLNATAVLRSAESGYLLFDLEAGDTTALLYGAACDIGTTTVVLRLVDLLSGEVAAVVSAANPQARHGADVISRVHFAESAEGLQALHDAIVQCLNDLLERACRKAGADRRHVYEMAVCGNTTMHHLLLKYPVSQLGQAPYRAYSTAAEDRPAAEAGLRIHPQGRLHTIANIAGFVGSDTVAAALAAGLDQTHQKSLLVDIGTNGEIVACHAGRLVTASCAAGPALEGAGILHGGRATEGAIQRVLVNGDDLDIDVIGGREAHSLCGSGLIDAAAVLLDLGVVESNGSFRTAEDLRHLPKAIWRRCVPFGDQPAFVLAWNKTGDSPQVVLTQKDIRMLQLANAAIRAGIHLLLRTLEVDANELEQVFLAGAFGSYINKESALRIGLLPNLAPEKIHSLGNAAADGVHMVLLSATGRKLCTKLAAAMEHIEIAHRPDFNDLYSELIFFPENTKNPYFY